MSRQEPSPEPLIESQPPTELAPAIPLEEVGRIAERVQELIAAGNEAAAWQRLRHLQPADVGIILAGLPRTSSETLLEIISAQTVPWTLQVASVAGERADGPMALSIRTRLPWLTINLATTFLAAATISLFESTLAQLVVSAAFLPVVAGQGGIGGTKRSP